ncbi:hypothetical protein D3C84_875000 [compost metagenome]
MQTDIGFAISAEVGVWPISVFPAVVDCGIAHQLDVASAVTADGRRREWVLHAFECTAADVRQRRAAMRSGAFARGSIDMVFTY